MPAKAGIQACGDPAALDSRLRGNDIVKEENAMSNGQRYNVGGILLDRPFKIRRLGHFGGNRGRG